MKKIILAITGASGIIYGIRLLNYLLERFHTELIISNSSIRVIKQETYLSFDNFEDLKKSFTHPNLKIYSDADISAPTASGSYQTEGMFIVPCSMKTLSAIANGYADNLITRTADVIIKEKRKLVIAPREMPLSVIHIENMLKLAKIGVIIAPPIPAFYHKPKNIDDIVNFIVGKLLDCMGIENNLYRRWNG
jgi:4-hydroxy-3-polyprenylbenzoate decarboxylase